MPKGEESKSESNSKNEGAQKAPALFLETAIARKNHNYNTYMDPLTLKADLAEVPINIHKIPNKKQCAVAVCGLKLSASNMNPPYSALAQLNPSMPHQHT